LLIIASVFKLSSQLMTRMQVGTVVKARFFLKARLKKPRFSTKFDFKSERLQGKFLLIVSEIEY